jgi:hypothetical protein
MNLGIQFEKYEVETAMEALVETATSVQKFVGNVSHFVFPVIQK